MLAQQSTQMPLVRNPLPVQTLSCPSCGFKNMILHINVAFHCQGCGGRLVAVRVKKH